MPSKNCAVCGAAPAFGTEVSSTTPRFGVDGRADRDALRRVELHEAVAAARPDAHRPVTSATTTVLFTTGVGVARRGCRLGLRRRDHERARDRRAVGIAPRIDRADRERVRAGRGRLVPRRRARQERSAVERALERRPGSEALNTNGGPPPSTASRAAGRTRRRRRRTARPAAAARRAGRACARRTRRGRRPGCPPGRQDRRLRRRGRARRRVAGRCSHGWRRSSRRWPRTRRCRPGRSPSYASPGRAAVRRVRSPGPGRGSTSPVLRARIEPCSRTLVCAE